MYKKKIKKQLLPYKYLLFHTKKCYLCAVTQVNKC